MCITFFSEKTISLIYKIVEKYLIGFLKSKVFFVKGKFGGDWEGDWEGDCDVVEITQKILPQLGVDLYLAFFNCKQNVRIEEKCEDSKNSSALIEKQNDEILRRFFEKCVDS